MDYARVSSEAELAEGLRFDGATILCGGTDLLVKMHAGISHPKLLLDISRLVPLQHLTVGPSGAEIGAAVPVADVLRSPAVSEGYPLLPMVLRALGSTQIRHRATLGGNLANASPAADSALPLLVYDATVLLASLDGARALPLRDFFRGPGRTALDRGEYIRSIQLPAPAYDWRPFFHKVGRRRALTIAIASAAALVALRGRTVIDARLAVGSVAPTPLRLTAIEDSVRGRDLTEELIQGTHAAVLASTSPIDDLRASARYRRRVTADLVSRFLASSTR